MGVEGALTEPSLNPAENNNGVSTSAATPANVSTSTRTAATDSPEKAMCNMANWVRHSLQTFTGGCNFLQLGLLFCTKSFDSKFS